MNKVLLAAPYGGVPGGISRWTGHIVDFYEKHGSNDCRLEILPMGRSMFVNINMPVWKRLWMALIDYRKILADFNRRIKAGHDVLHLTSSGSLSLYKDIYMLRQAHKYGVKSIIHFRFGRIPELAHLQNREWRLVRKAVNLADRTIVIDQASYDTLIAHGFDNIELLPNPVAPTVERIISENRNITRIPREILFTGHVVKTKGVFELLEACSNLDGIHLKMVGHVTSEMQHEIEEIYGSPQWLSVCGEMPYDEVIKEMLRCDVFVLPTYTEGFPNVILEAMAAGCAIISTPVGAIPQMLEDDDKGKYGVLVEPRQVSSLSDAIASLLDDESLKSEMRHNVQERVRERYNIQSVWNRMVSVWES